MVNKKWVLRGTDIYQKFIEKHNSYIFDEWFVAFFYLKSIFKSNFLSNNCAKQKCLVLTAWSLSQTDMVQSSTNFSESSLPIFWVSGWCCQSWSVHASVMAIFTFLQLHLLWCPALILGNFNKQVWLSMCMFAWFTKSCV